MVIYFKQNNNIISKRFLSILYCIIYIVYYSIYIKYLLY